ncbi:MAG TPA: hypothetical protein VNG12_21665 [Acidimicrobiales bacterium]|nr:hypothetical protein [Acidimicrobiales bacterium]
MKPDPMRMCELLVGLPEANVLAVVDEVNEMLRVHVETRAARTGCERCGVVARVKERPKVELVAPVLRSFDQAGVAQAQVVVPRADLFDGQLDRGEPQHRSSPHGDERSGRSMGHRTGWSQHTERE